MAGIAREYLLTNFSQLPSDPTLVKNGHVLFLYVENGKSVPLTIKSIEETWKFAMQPYQIRSIAKRSLHRYRNLSRQKDMTSFSEVSHM